MNDVPRILAATQHGDPSAAEELLPIVYEELRKLAAAELAREKPGQTLQATALVHEAYLRLVGNKLTAERSVVGRRQFIFAAAQAMRRILIERARARAALKRGGQRQRIDLESLEPAEPEIADELLAIHAALQRLEAVEPQASKLVQLRYFGGCTMEEAVELLGISLRSGHRLWAYAKAWLLEELQQR